MLTGSVSPVLIAADYNQLEARIAADLSGDPVMIQVFQEGRSIHEETLWRIFHTRKSPESLRQYTTAKAINFLTLYGGGAEKIVEQLEKLGLEPPSKEQAEEWLSMHRETYSGYWKWAAEVVRRAKQPPHVSYTIMGRPRFLPDIVSTDPSRRYRAERQAVNHCVQGSASDVCKAAMREVYRHPLLSRVGRMVAQIHDEILYRLDEEAVLEEACDALRSCMSAPKLRLVPLVVDVGYGSNWAEAHK